MSRPTPVRDAVLVALAERGPMTTPEVVQTIRSETNSVSSALNRLLKDGLVQVKRTKPGAAAAGMNKRPPNIWRIKPGVQIDSFVNKNIHGTSLLGQAIAASGDKLTA